MLFSASQEGAWIADSWVDVQLLCATLNSEVFLRRFEMNKSYNPEMAIRARDRFVSRFVSLMNKRVDYAFETTLFSLIYMGLPTLFVFLLLPLHAFGIISDPVLLSLSIHALPPFVFCRCSKKTPTCNKPCINLQAHNGQMWMRSTRNSVQNEVT